MENENVDEVQNAYDDAIVTLESLIDDLKTVRDKALEDHAEFPDDDDDIANWVRERAQDIIAFTHWE